jgi:hypothetical protein
MIRAFSSNLARVCGHYAGPRTTGPFEWSKWSTRRAACPKAKQQQARLGARVAIVWDWGIGHQVLSECPPCLRPNTSIPNSAIAYFAFADCRPSPFGWCSERPPWLSSVLLSCFLLTRSTGEIHGVVVSSNANNHPIPSAAFGVIVREAFGAKGKLRDIRGRENGRERWNESSPQTTLAHHQRRRARTPRSRS